MHSPCSGPHRQDKFYPSLSYIHGRKCAYKMTVLRLFIIPSSFVAENESKLLSRLASI